MNHKKEKAPALKWGKFGGLWLPGMENSKQDDDLLSPEDIGLESTQPTADIADTVHQFVPFACNHLSLDRPPKIRLKRDPAWSQRNRSFGSYSPGTKTICVSTAGRHAVDVLRTLAHEMVHYYQDCTTGLPDGAGQDGSEFENEANATAAVIMRKFAAAHPECFGSALHESAGYIPTNAAEANDPRYSNAVTVDVKPGETKRQAAKLGFATDAAGVPPLLKPSGK